MLLTCTWDQNDCDLLCHILGLEINKVRIKIDRGLTFTAGNTGFTKKQKQ